MSSILVATVTFNSLSVVRALIDAVEEFRNGHPANDVRMVIVDNGSDDGTRELVARIATKHDWVRLVLARRNLGYGAGINLGIFVACQVGFRPSSVLVANPDLRMGGGDIAALIDSLQGDEALWAVGPRLVDITGKRVSDARDLPTWRSLAFRSVKEAPDTTRVHAVVMAGWLSGGCMLWRFDRLIELGGFDPRYFLFYEDVDLCKRALDAGAVIGYIPWVSVEHLVGHSHGSNRHARQASARSRRIYARTHLGVIGLLAALVADLGEAMRTLVNHGLGTK